MYQGHQYAEFEVDATAFHPEAEGLLGMAISRVMSLEGLKLTGIRSFSMLQKKATADWKVVLFMSKYMNLPAAAVEAARAKQAVWIESWLQHDKRMSKNGTTSGSLDFLQRFLGGPM